MADPTWFADQIVNMEAEVAANRRRDVTFEQPALDWRHDPDLEPLAYNKGALLAFAMDQMLRSGKKPSSLFEMFRNG